MIQEKYQKELNEINKEGSITSRIIKLIDFVFEIRNHSPEDGLALANEIIKLSKEAKYRVGRARGHNHKAVCYWLLSDYENALRSLRKALRLALEIRNLPLQARVYNNYGKVYREMGDLALALQYFQKAISIYESTEDEIELSVVLSNISLLHFDLYEYDNALEYAKRCLPFFIKQNNKERLAMIYQTLGNIYFKQEKYAEALNHFHISLMHCEKDTLPFMLGEAGVGKVSYKMGHFDLAVKYLKSALEFAELHSNPEGYIIAHFYLGRIHLDRNEFDKAREHFVLSFDSATEHSRLHNVMSIHEVMSQMYEKTGDINKAFSHLKLYEKLKEDIFQENTINKLRNLQTRQEIELAQKEGEVAKQTALLKQQFIANMSHEIRTPMNAIVGMTNLLLEKEPKKEQLRYLNVIRQSAENLLVVINDILDISKLEAGKVRIEKIPFAIKDCVKNVVNLLRIKAEEKGLTIWFELDDDVPKYLRGDPTRLTQILMNLAGNAVKFTEKGRVDLSVSLLEQNNDYCRLKFNVADTGIGISEEYVHRIFESFTQAGTDLARKFGGSGLGLTISKQLVELMEGEISVQSKLGQGTTFTCIIPFQIQKEEIGEEVKIKFSLTAAEINHLNTLKILLVEDNEFNRILAIDILKDIAPEMDIEIATDGIAALEMAGRMKFDLILMDIQMPVMGGLEATKKIRELGIETPVLAMTANVMQDDIENYLLGGMNDHIPKPFEKEELLTKILKYSSGVSGIEKANGKEERSEKEGTFGQLTNLSFLRSISSGKPARIAKYVTMFLSQEEELFNKMKDAYQQEDLSQLKILSHSLKSQLKYMGVEEEYSHIQELEDLAERGFDRERQKEIMENLQSVLPKIKQELQKTINEL